MAQSDAFHESWSYLRDNAKPIREIDVWELREAREVFPPSKAHVKRLLRRRAEITRPSKVLQLGDDTDGARRKAIVRAQRAAEIAAFCKTTR